MATVQEDIQALQKQLDEATDYDERTALRRKIRELKKASGQAVGSVRRGDAGYRRPGTGLKGPSNKPIAASTVHHGGSYLASSVSAGKVSAAGAPKRALSPAVDSAKQEAVSPSSSLPSSRKSSQSVESKDSPARPQAGSSRDQTASPVGSANEPLDVNERPSNDRDTPIDRDVAPVQPDVEETDLGEEVVQQKEEERQEEEEAAPFPVEQVEVEHTRELEAEQDEPEDEQDEPEDTPEVTPVEPEEQPEEVEEEEVAEEPSAVQEHEPEQEEVQEEYPPADEAETHREAEEEPEPEKREPEPEKREPSSRRPLQPQGEVRKDKKGPEQVDFRNVLRKTEKPATVIASSKFYKSGSSKSTTSEAKQDSDEPRRTESPVHNPPPQPFQVNGAEDVDSVVEAYEARREARRKAREARRKSTDEKKTRDDTEKLTYREKREQELKKQASQSGAPQQQQSAPPRPMQRQTSSSNPTKQLLQWAQHKTRFYDDVNVTDFTHSFKDGLALAAIMHCYVPECVPMEELSVHTPRRNFEVAFAAAKEAGIPEMLDADDFLSVTIPDAQSVMTYLVTVYQHFN